MKMSQIREMTDPELDRHLEELTREKYNITFQAKTGQWQNTARIQTIRRELARAKTERNQRCAKQS